MEKLDQQDISKLEALIKYGTDITQLAKQVHPATLFKIIVPLFVSVLAEWL